MLINPILSTAITDELRRISSQVPIETKRKVYLATRQMNYDIRADSFQNEMEQKRRWPAVVAYLNENVERMRESVAKIRATLTDKERAVLDRMTDHLEAKKAEPPPTKEPNPCCGGVGFHYIACPKWDDNSEVSKNEP